MSTITEYLCTFRKPQNKCKSSLGRIAVAQFICGAVLIAAMLLVPELSEAATDVAHSKVAGEAELTSAFKNIQGLVSGVVGKIITIVALGFGLAGSIFKFNPAAIAGAFGVALTAAFGPSAVVAVIGATF